MMLEEYSISCGIPEIIGSYVRNKKRFKDSEEIERYTWKSN